MHFADFVNINPSMSLEKNVEYSFVDMESIDSKHRYVRHNKRRKFKNGGAKFQSGDTLFARITPCLENGKIAQVVELDGGIGFGSTEFFVFRAKPGISTPGYVYYLALSKEIRSYAEKSMTGASGRQRADINAIKNIEIYSPPVSVQNKITTTLSNLDNLIDKNHQRIKLLEEIVKKIYHNWFINLCFPGHENKHKFKSALAKFHKKWRKVKIGSLLKKLPSKKKIKKNNYLQIGKIPIIDQSKKFIAGYTNDLKSIYETNLPLIIFGDHTRILKYIDFPFARGADGTQIICSNDEKIPNIFLYYVLLNNKITNAFYSRHYKFIKMKEIILPTYDLISKFVEFAEPVRNKISILQKKNEYLTNSRDLLLPKLMSGEINVSNINIKDNNKDV